jgi:hypothetical protein
MPPARLFVKLTENIPSMGLLLPVRCHGLHTQFGNAYFSWSAFAYTARRGLRNIWASIDRNGSYIPFCSPSRCCMATLSNELFTVYLADLPFLWFLLSQLSQQLPTVLPERSTYLFRGINTVLGSLCARCFGLTFRSRIGPSASGRPLSFFVGRRGMTSGTVHLWTYRAHVNVGGAESVATLCSINA